MTDFEEPFTSQDIDQQLEQLLSKASENGPNAQLLANLHTFHHAAASAERRSIASAWERIEYRRRMQRERLSEKKPLPLHNTVNRTVVLSPRTHEKRGLVTLVAILIAVLLIGGIRLALIQKSTSVASPVLSSVTPSTPGQQQSKTGTVVYTDKGADNGMVLAWSPDGKRILSAGTDVHIWDATTGQHPVTYRPVTRSIPIQNAAWAPDNSQRVAIADGTGVRIINANTGDVLLTGPQSSSVGLASWHPFNSQSSIVGLTTLNSQSPGTASVRALAWSPDGKEIASSVSLENGTTTPRTITIWNSHTGAVIKQLSGHTDDIYEVAWSPDGKYLASLAQSQDNTIRLWNLATGTQIYTVHPPSVYGGMERLEWSPNGQYLAVQMQVQVGNNTVGTIITKDEIQVWKALTHQVLTKYPSLSPGYDFTGFSWAPDSARIVSAIGNNTRIWNALTGHNLSAYQGKHQEMIMLVAWSPDGRYIALAGSLVLGQARINTTEVWKIPGNV